VICCLLGQWNNLALSCFAVQGHIKDFMLTSIICYTPHPPLLQAAVKFILPWQVVMHTHMYSLRANFVKQNFIQFPAQPKLSGTTAPSRLGHPHHQVFTITCRNTAFGVGLLCTSDQPNTQTTHSTHYRDIHSSSRFQTRILVNERLQTHALDSMATGIDSKPSKLHKILGQQHSY